MNYAAEYKIDVNPVGVTATDIGTALSKKLRLTGIQGLQFPGREFPLGVAYDLLQVGAGLEEEAREKHMSDVRGHGTLAITDSDILLTVEPLSAIAEDSSRYDSIAIKVTPQGAKFVTPRLIEELRAELAGTR